MSNLRLLPAALLFATGCVAMGGGGGPGGGAGPRLELSSTRTETCVPLRTRWSIEGALQGAEVFRSGGKWVLVYETLMRSGPRTVWQPLRDDLAFDGDGVVAGLKGLPLVADFRVQSDSPGNMWVTYRSKAPSSELYGAFVEQLPARDSSRILRVRLPTGPSESVQEVWLLPPTPAGPPAGKAGSSPAGAGSGTANIVVRANPYAEQGEEQSVFRWYAVNAAKGTAKTMGEYRAASETLAGARFVSLAGSGEPVVFAIASQNRDFDAADPKWQRASFRIVARRLFARAKDEVVVHESNAPLGALTLDALPATPGGYLLAWIQEPSGGENTILRWASLRFDPSEKGFAAFKKSMPKPLRSPPPAPRGAASGGGTGDGEEGTAPEGAAAPLFANASPDALPEYEAAPVGVLVAGAAAPGAPVEKPGKHAAAGGGIGAAGQPAPVASQGSPGLHSLEVDHDPVRLKFRALRLTPQPSPSASTGTKQGNVPTAFGLTWWTASDEDSGYLMTQVFPAAPQIAVDDGYDSKGQPRRRMRPATVGVYAPGRRARIVGVAEAAGPGGVDVLLQTEGTGDKAVESGTTVSLCAIAGR